MAKIFGSTFAEVSGSVGNTIGGLGRAITEHRNAGDHGRALGPQMIGDDPASLLPPLAREKFETLSFAADAASVENAQYFERAQELHEQIQRHSQRLSSLQRSYSSRGTADAAITSEQATIEKLKDEKQRLDERHAARKLRSAPLRELYANLRRYVEGPLCGAQTIELAPPTPAPALKKESSFADAVKTVRAKLEKLEDDLFCTDNAPLTSSVAVAKMKEQVHALAERGRPAMLELLEGRENFSLPTRMPPIELVRSAEGGMPGELVPHPRFDAEGFIAFLFEDVIVTRLSEEIRGVADDKSALTDEARAQRMMELSAQILSAEREEEALVLAAEAAGQALARRPAADPRAILQLSDAMPPARRR